MHLATDAVRAAAESPFLDGVLENASAVLCTLSLPPVGQALAGGNAVLAAMLTPEGERHATRMAAQAAAGALSSLTGPGCQDFVMCAEPRPELVGGGGGSGCDAAGDDGVVYVEATLLVLRKPGSERAQGGAGAGAAAAGRQLAGGLAAAAAAPPPVSAPQPQDGVPAPAGGHRLPASSWNMLSALAGGGAARGGRGSSADDDAVHGEREVAPAVPAPAPQQQRPPPNMRSPFMGTVATSPSASDSAVAAPGAPLQPQARVPVQRLARPAAAAAARAPAAAPEPPAQQQPPPMQQQQQQQQQPQAQAQQRVTVAEYLVDSLSAQSLDLPPAAARWRQQQRGDVHAQRRLIVWEVDEIEPWVSSGSGRGGGAACVLLCRTRRLPSHVRAPTNAARQEEEEEGPSGLAALLPGRRKERRVNLRERMAGILAQDREEAAEADGDGEGS